jgi:hypothetical protein
MNDLDILKVQLMTTEHIKNLVKESMKQTQSMLKKNGENTESQYGLGYTDSQRDLVQCLTHLADGFAIEMNKIKGKKIVTLDDVRKEK